MCTQKQKRKLICRVGTSGFKCMARIRGKILAPRSWCQDWCEGTPRRKWGPETPRPAWKGSLFWREDPIRWFHHYFVPETLTTVSSGKWNGFCSHPQPESWNFQSRPLLPPTAQRIPGNPYAGRPFPGTESPANASELSQSTNFWNSESLLPNRKGSQASLQIPS